MADISVYLGHTAYEGAIMTDAKKKKKKDDGSVAGSITHRECVRACMF